MDTEREKRLATATLTNSDRITKAMRQRYCQQFSSRQQAIPPSPKLRARPGEIYRRKSRQYNADQPYWVVKYAFRLKDSPNIWQFVLEERADLCDPSTPISVMCLSDSAKHMSGEARWSKNQFGMPRRSIRCSRGPTTSTGVK